MKDINIKDVKQYTVIFDVHTNDPRSFPEGFEKSLQDAINVYLKWHSDYEINVSLDFRVPDVKLKIAATQVRVVPFWTE